MTSKKIQGQLINNSFKFLNSYSLVEKLNQSSPIMRNILVLGIIKKSNFSLVYSKSNLCKKLKCSGNRVKIRLTGLICVAILLKNKEIRFFSIHPIALYPEDRSVYIGEPKSKRIATASTIFSHERFRKKEEINGAKLELKFRIKYFSFFLFINVITRIVVIVIVVVVRFFNKNKAINHLINPYLIPINGKLTILHHLSNFANDVQNRCKLHRLFKQGPIESEIVKNLKALLQLQFQMTN
ncbi:hypothetical protein BpHYR1_019513 [Brachionus plicatilis]|uniref:Uncharacterized protein n=1 Tax=Brachionus plicatilis TaxID=10195 RepID=A0A3M7PWL5_BRAPC|nr:hypothetical protein BpHYR1_019513 [Brachionus plicatilis]